MKKHWILIIAAVLFTLGFVLQMVFKNLFSSGNYSLNYFAVGDYAIGVFAAGKFSVGIFSIGIFSIGIFSIGIFNIGLYAIGIFVLAHKKRLPGLFREYSKQALSSVKTPLMLVFFLLMQFSLLAQNTKRFSLRGGFGGPAIALTAVAQQPMLTIGGGGAAVFKNGLFVGGYGLGTSDMITVNSIFDGYKLQVEHGGLWLGYQHKIAQNYGISMSLKSGLGEVMLNNVEERKFLYDDITVFTPEISISKRLNGYSALSFGIFYNAYSGVNLQTYKSRDFSNIGISMMLKFGGGDF